MVNHICKNCFKSFSRKSDYIYHTEKKKNPCQQIHQIPSKTTSEPPNPTIKPPNPTIKPPIIAENPSTVDKIINIDLGKKD